MGISFKDIMDIGEVSKKSGISTSALRYYEEVGLITPSGRKGLRRQYDSNTLEILAIITLAKQAGFLLQELPRLIKTKKGFISLEKSELKKKSTEMDATIKRLQAARDGLIHASHCHAPRHLECPKFLRLLRIATKRQIKGKK